MQTSMVNWRKWPIEKGEIDIFGEKKKIFYRGNWDKKLFERSITIVGSRKMSRYGVDVIDRFVPELVGNGITIISGFMYGVDTQAHRTCLEMGGTTIAVLGSGLNCLTPAENDDLYTEILNKGGLVMSEYEPEFKATVWSFPQRDRILAGLPSMGVLVVEAGMKSGSLITARIAKENNIKIWSIPGPITSSVSQGTNWLITEGWGEMTVAPDLITHKKIVQESLLDIDIPTEQKQIMDLLKIEALSIDEIARKTGKAVSELGITISLMSLTDLVKEEGGKIFAKRN